MIKILIGGNMDLENEINKQEIVKRDKKEIQKTFELFKLQERNYKKRFGREMPEIEKENRYKQVFAPICYFPSDKWLSERNEKAIRMEYEIRRMEYESEIRKNKKKIVKAKKANVGKSIVLNGIDVLSNKVQGIIIE